MYTNILRSSYTRYIIRVLYFYLNIIYVIINDVIYNPVSKNTKNNSYCRVRNINFEVYFFIMYDAFCVATRFFSIILHFLYHTKRSFTHVLPLHSTHQKFPVLLLQNQNHHARCIRGLFYVALRLVPSLLALFLRPVYLN